MTALGENLREDQKTKLECPTCARLIRPCNMARHRAACDHLARIATEIVNEPWTGLTRSCPACGVLMRDHDDYDITDCLARTERARNGSTRRMVRGVYWNPRDRTEGRAPKINEWD